MSAATLPAAGAIPTHDLPTTERLRVNEIFYSLQGESTRAGLPCVLIRLTGCHLRCRWCDTAYAFYEGEWLSRAEVLTDLCDAGYEVLLETSGAVDVAPVDPRVRKIVDVKCPGSGEAERNHWGNLDLLRPTDELKLVIAGEADYRWARDLVLDRQLHCRCPVHFSPVAGELDPATLAQWILRDRLPVRLQLQLHQLLWGNARGT
jgi:7-carboxy-7-deazaguanine synthase